MLQYLGHFSILRSPSACTLFDTRVLLAQLYFNNSVRRCPTMLALLAHTPRNTDLRKPVVRSDSGNRAPLPHNVSAYSLCTP